MSRASQGRRTGERSIALSATILLHMLAALLILSSPRIADPPLDDAALTVFDVAPPPIAPIDPPPDPPLPQATAPTTPAPAPAGAIDPRQTSPAAASPPDTTETLIAPSIAIPQEFGRGTQSIGMGDIGGGGAGPGIGGDGAGGNGRGDGGLPRALYYSPSWIRMPSEVQMREAWPSTALTRKLSGEAVLHCWILPSGRPRTCLVAREAPADGGFGAASVRLSRVFRIKPILHGKTIVDLPVVVPVTWTYRTR